MNKFITWILLLLIVSIDIAFAKPVSVFDVKKEQFVTSSLLAWEPYQTNNSKQFEFAVNGGEYLKEDHKAYICRSTINQVPLTGYVKKHSGNSYVCIISQHKQLKTKGEFDLLLNRGNGAKIEWKDWDHINVIFTNMDGTVSTMNGGSRSEVYYIARHKINHSLEHHEIDHAIGWFDKQEGFGKIHATVVSAEESFDNGQILTTFEPIRYELHDIKFNSQKLRENRNRTMLGQSMLKNDDDKPVEVNSVIGYEYNLVRNLGNHEGIAANVNTTVFAAKKEVYKFIWRIQKDDRIVNTKGIGTVLEPGTALNVTLWGNYTIKEGPYDAHLFIYWSDGSKSKKLRINVKTGMEASLEDQLEIEYSPTYWLHNNTVVPTTTQRTTTSTSTTHKSIFSTSMSSNSIEKITEKTVKNENSIGVEYEDVEENEVDKTSSSTNIHIKSCLIMLIIMNLIHLMATH